MKEMLLRNTTIGIVWLAAMIGSGCEEPIQSTPESMEPAAVAVVEAGDLSSLSSNAMNLPADGDVSSVLNAAEFEPLEEECCTGPGDVAECWVADAEEDGVLCSAHSDCPSNQCNFSKGRCMCSSDADCNDGVCADSGICGPSWCNGYRKCSCWGGCEWWADDPAYTLYDMATESGRYCCEGVYSDDPITIDPILGGFFSITSCGRCGVASDCDDGNPCTLDVCDEGTCANNKLNGDLDAVPDAIDCPMNSSLYSSDCARQKCDNGVCAIQLDWKVGQVCVNGPDNVPATYQAACYTRACTAAGKCGTTIKTNQSCSVSGNTCAAGKCNASALCVAGVLTDAQIATKPQCCNPAKPASFEDNQVCTTNYCCQGKATDPPTCTGVLPFWDRYVPNYNPATPNNCCVDSVNCDDGNSCTNNICCGSANAGLAICGGNAAVPTWSCVEEVNDAPGCCDSAPASLADNCDDPFGCTEDVCCTPAAIAAAVAGDPCFGASEYNCADSGAFDSPPVGCCDPDVPPSTHCDDTNFCTVEFCDSRSMTCEREPQPLFSGCCGPNPGDACGDDDNNVCTDEVCCDPLAIASAQPGDPCFNADEWSCGTVVAGDPGCCTTPAECSDGNPCTQDLCVANQCAWDSLDDLSGAAAGVCCTLGGTNDAQCSDGSDPGDCTQNVCCSPAMVASAVPGDPCFGSRDWGCENPAETPAPAGCCDPLTVADDCNPDGNICAVEDCVNSNCTWTINDAPAACCDVALDCAQPGAPRPCLSATTCNLTGNPLTNAAYAQCEYTYKAQGTVCDAGGECYDKVCADPAAEDWSCSQVANVPAYGEVGALTCTSPASPPCSQYWCDGSGACATAVDTSNVYANATCGGAGNIGSGAVINQNAQVSTCATKDYTPASTGIFSECAGATYSDVTYTVGDSIMDDYLLQHRWVSAKSTGTAWNPLLYARKTCADGSESNQRACNDNCTFAGSNYLATNADYTGLTRLGACTVAATESTVVVGPFAVTDVPNHPIPTLPALATQDFDRNNIRDAYDVQRMTSTSLIVDSRYTTPANGGTFDLSAGQETHNNNDCRNIGSYGASPIIDGSFQWKQRWRGEIVAARYDNYFGATGPRMGYDGTKSITATNPHQAFFKVQIPSGSGKYMAFTDWMGKKKRGEWGYVPLLDAATNAASASFFDPVLSILKPSGSDSNNCSNAAGDITSSVYTDGKGLPPWLVMDTSAAGWGTRWLAISNRQQDAYGKYELSLIKAQPTFFGFHTAYSEVGSGRGCGSLGDFDAEGYRLDFVPNGSTENGYVMTHAYLGDGPDNCPNTNNGTDSMWDWGWLVHPECYGPNAGNSSKNTAINYTEYKNLAAHAKWLTLPFAFPMGDDFYDRLYIDTTGRIEPRKTFGSCTAGNNATCDAKPECAAAPAKCVCVSEFGNQCAYNPGSINPSPDVAKLNMPYSAGGNAPVIAGAWGAFQPVWKNGTKGFITLQSVIFEGQVSYVISFVGMDIDNSASSDLSLFENISSWNKYYVHPSYQVILRNDGRITYYYRPDYSGAVKPAWDETVDRGAFMIALSGGSSTITCNADAECQALHGTEATCDRSGPGGYTPTKRCMRKVSPLVDGTQGLGNE